MKRAEVLFIVVIIAFFGWIGYSFFDWGDTVPKRQCAYIGGKFAGHLISDYTLCRMPDGSYRSPPTPSELYAKGEWKL